MFQRDQGATSFTSSLNYNFSRNAPNIYLLIGRQFTLRTNAGVSTGGGRGVFSDSSHALAFGVDLTHDFGGVQFCSEYNYADGANSSFQYVSSKLTFAKKVHLSTNLARTTGMIPLRNSVISAAWEGDWDIE